jgi:hypothetical protein
MAVTKGNIENSTTKHETSKPNSENPNEEEDSECISYRETFLNPASGEI